MLVIYQLECLDGIKDIGTCSIPQIIHIKYVQFFVYMLYINKAIFKETI